MDPDPCWLPDSTAAATAAPPDWSAPLKKLLRNLRGGLRLALLQRVTREDFAATTEAYALLIVTHLVILLALGVAQVGPNGQINYFELPRALLIVPLTLAFGLLIAQANRDSATLLVMAVALTAAGTLLTVILGVMGLVMQGPLEVLRGRYWRYLYYFTFAWWFVVVTVAVLRLTPSGLRRRIGNVLAGLIVLVLPVWFLPQGYLWVPAHDADEEVRGGRSGFWALAEESGYYAQQDMLSRALAELLPERRGVPDVYLIAAGLYASEDVFMKEVKVIETLFKERFDADGRALALINNPKTIHEHPVASLTSLGASLQRVGSLMNPDEDVLVLYLSSHGSETHKLSVQFWPLRLNDIDPRALKQVLDQSGIQWKVVVVSACYSGGFIEPLKDERTLIITASSAGRQSFGCGNESDSTYLAKALFDEELRKTYSFEEAFKGARKSIERREQEQGFTPSEPQIHVGASVRDKLKQIERRLATISGELSDER
jgi:hypothetical protein